MTMNPAKTEAKNLELVPGHRSLPSMPASGVTLEDISQAMLKARMERGKVEEDAPSQKTSSDVPTALNMTSAEEVDSHGMLASSTSGSSAPETEVDGGVFESFFDLTHERLVHIFTKVRKNSEQSPNGTISYEALKEGLKQWAGLSDIDDPALFEKLIKFLDADNSGDITFSEFERGISLLMLNHLFQGQLEAAPFVVCDYDNLQLAQAAIQTEDECRKFAYSCRPPWTRCRWIDVCQSSDVPSPAGVLTLKRLAVKYRLHPLSLEDALMQNPRSKCDVYASHFFVCADVFVLEASRETTSTLPVSVNIEHASIFVSRGEDGTSDTLISFFKSTRTHDECSALWRRIRRELEKSYSKLRQYDGQYLAYAMLDALVDRLFPIVEAFRTAMQSEREKMVKEGFKDLQVLFRLKAELERVLRKLRPLERLLHHVIEDDRICSGVTIYLRDVRDNLESCADELKALVDRCDSLQEEFEKFHTGQMDRTMYRLTVVTSIFLPAQFLTGVFGMNFRHMPELEWEASYPIFWAFSIAVFAVGLCLYFRCGESLYGSSPLNRR